MPIAVFHNYLDNIGGAERVSLTLGRELGADVFSTVADAQKIRRMGFSQEVKTLGWIPINAPFRQQLALWRFRTLKLEKEYDYYIISGDWAVSGAVNNKPNMWYVHSPIREIWDLYLYTRNNLVPPIARPVFDVWVRWNRRLNKDYVKHVTKIVCNSENTRQRVRKFLGRKSKVIHPPVETDLFHHERSRGYWLSVNRLVSPKRVEMQVEAFRRMPDQKLIIVGSYEESRHFKEYSSYIKRIAPSNVNFLNHVSFEKLVSLYARCEGFITTAKDEDFGMTAVEAMASGKPVIAPCEGGYKESVIDGETGMLIKDISPNKICATLKSLDTKSCRRSCERQALNFSVSTFIKRISREIQ